MRDLKLVKPGVFEIFDSEVPQPGPGEVLVRSEAVGVCGSDIHAYQDGGIGDSKIPFPFTLGHETTGTVMGLGEGASAPKVGTKVTIEPGLNCGVCEWCQKGHPNICPNIRFHGSPPVEGTYREYFTHPAHLCIPLPRGMSVEDGVMLEPLAIGVHAIRLMKMEPGASVGVLGCGPVGLLCLAVARACGAGKIYAADLHDYRLEIAKKYGADVTINAADDNPADAVNETTNGRGVDLVIEATTDPTAPDTGLHMMAIGGSLAVIGIVSEKAVSFDTHVARRKAATVKWVRRSKFGVHEAIEFAASGRIPVDGLVTHVFPLAETHSAFEMVEAYSHKVFKAVVEPTR